MKYLVVALLVQIVFPFELDVEGVEYDLDFGDDYGSLDRGDIKRPFVPVDEQAAMMRIVEALREGKYGMESEAGQDLESSNSFDELKGLNFKKLREQSKAAHQAALDALRKSVEDETYSIIQKEKPGNTREAEAKVDVVEVATTTHSIDVNVVTHNSRSSPTDNMEIDPTEISVDNPEAEIAPMGIDSTMETTSTEKYEKTIDGDFIVPVKGEAESQDRNEEWANLILKKETAHSANHLSSLPEGGLDIMSPDQLQHILATTPPEVIPSAITSPASATPLTRNSYARVPFIFGGVATLLSHPLRKFSKEQLTLMSSMVAVALTNMRSYAVFKEWLRDALVPSLLEARQWLPLAAYTLLEGMFRFSLIHTASDLLQSRFKFLGWNLIVDSMAAVLGCAAAAVPRLVVVLQEMGVFRELKDLGLMEVFREAGVVGVLTEIQSVSIVQGWDLVGALKSVTTDAPFYIVSATIFYLQRRVLDFWSQKKRIKHNAASKFITNLSLGAIAGAAAAHSMLLAGVISDIRAALWSNIPYFAILYAVYQSSFVHPEEHPGTAT